MNAGLFLSVWCARAIRDTCSRLRLISRFDFPPVILGLDSHDVTIAAVDSIEDLLEKARRKASNELEMYYSSLTGSERRRETFAWPRTSSHEQFVASSTDRCCSGNYNATSRPFVFKHASDTS